MAHSNHEIREVKGPFGETTYRAYCCCGYYTKHVNKLDAELCLADHLMSAIEEAIAPVVPADNFVDTRKNEKPDTRSRHEWFRDHEIGRNYL